MDRIEASYSDIGQNGANPCALARVKGEKMQETTDLRALDARTDGDSSANISGFAVQMLSTPIPAMRLSPSYQTLACTKDLRQMACKNSPRKSVYCSMESKPQGEF